MNKILIGNKLDKKDHMKIFCLQLTLFNFVYINNLITKF